MKIRKSYLNVNVHEGVQLFEVGVKLFNKPVKPVYFFYVDGLLIDSGPSLAFNRIHKATKPLPVKQILLTHTHEDHSGNAARLGSVYQVPVYGHSLAVDIMNDGFQILPYQKLMFGKAGKVQLNTLKDRFNTPNFNFEVIHTPGHADEHVALYERSKGWLFPGDMFVAERIKYFRKDECLKTQIASLKRLTALDFEVMFCSHNPQIKNGKMRLERKLKNFIELYEAIVYHHNLGKSTAQIAEEVGLGKGWDIGLFTFGDVKPEYIITSVTKNLM